MRLGVIDVGSNTVHLLVVDAHVGAHPLPASSHKIELRLAEYVDADGSIARSGADALVEFTSECLTIAEDQQVDDLLAFATSAIREAPNGEAVLARVRAETGVELQVLSGEDESKLTFLAVRRWFGWSSGRLLVMDIGGGSLELAATLRPFPRTTRRRWLVTPFRTEIPSSVLSTTVTAPTRTDAHDAPPDHRASEKHQRDDDEGHGRPLTGQYTQNHSHGDGEEGDDGPAPP